MDYRYLGKTGLKVSELCLGAMTFGREASEQESVQMLDRFVEAGGNFIDTADVYSRGASEEILGRWLAGKSRDDLVVATKVRWGTDDPTARRPNRFGLGRKHIVAAVDASLKRLQTDYIDLYQVHMWDSVTPLEETLSTLDMLVRAGKIRYPGASNYSGWQLQKAVDLAKANGWQPYVSLQPLYNLLDRELEWELLPVCLNEGLGVMPWSPLRGGWLSGKCPSRAGSADLRHAGRDRRGARLERDMGEIRQRADLGCGRHARRPGERARQDARPDRFELAASASRSDLAHHRREEYGSARG